MVGAEAGDQLAMVLSAFRGKARASTSVAEVVHRHAAKGRSSRWVGSSCGGAPRSRTSGIGTASSSSAARHSPG